MTYSQKIVESYSRLQSALMSLLQGQSVELAVLQEGDYPLLVLETSGDSAGFAIINGIPETAFTSAYVAFKQLYRRKHAVWKERNLSFVVCRSELKTIHDAFFNSLEMDVYFCRKYVLCFLPDQGGLERELLRLPFLPLPEGRSGGIVRPPSAQTLLQSLGIKAYLARQIIVPREYSASRIVAEVSGQTESLSEIGTATVSHEQHEVEPTERTRINSVVIEAFRAYRKRQDFDLDADVVVLYGPNGLGKTSFFDALDYACTGRIGRLCRRRISQKNFMDLARHLGTLPRAGSVTMEVTRGSSAFLVRRTIDDWGHAFVDGDEYDRANTLQFLTSAHWGSKKPRIENLERLFRATHLFSQTDQELLVEFAKDSKLSADLVSRTLALDDYASGLSKAGEVLALLERQLNEIKQKSDVLKSQIAEAQARIKTIPEPQEFVRAGQQLKKLTTKLVKDLRMDARITVDDTEVTVNEVREWRAIIQSALKETRDRVSQLQTLDSGFAQFEKNKSSLKVRTSKLFKLDEAIKKHSADRSRLEEAKRKLLVDLKQSKTALAQVKKKRRALSELIGLQDVALKAQASLQQYRQELKRVEGEATKVATELQPLLPAIEKLNIRISELQEALEVRSQRIQTLTAIQNGLAIWERERVEATKLQQSIAAAHNQTEKVNSSINEYKRGIDAQMAELAARDKEYEKLTAHQAELTRLLDQIEAHVSDGLCPTCGTDHRTKAALIERIHAQKEIRPSYVEELAKRCRELRKALEVMNASVASLIREQESKKKVLDELSGKFSTKRESVTAFERLVEQPGFSVDGQEIRTTITRLLAEETTARQASQDILSKLKVESSEKNRRLKALEKKQAQVEEGRKRANDAIEPLEQQMRMLHSKAEAMDLSLDMDPSNLRAEQETWASREAETEKQVIELTSEEDALTRAAARVEALLDEAKVSAVIIRQKKEALETELMRYEEGAAGVIGREPLDLDNICKQRKQTTERGEILERLMQRSLTLERALDSVQRSAMLAELDSKVHALTMQKQEIDDKTRRMSAIKKWFTQVRDILEQQNSDAVENHVCAFGPLTTLIQKRLRTVYGFGDISMLPKGNEIRVVVGWERENVKPTDYFSDSQKQILMLSIFLAGRLTQTWSGFAPILLDDPVTHFDDLNAFGFVELIRGLVSTSPGKRQFLISTCEDRLFELMRKKFGSIKGGAKFYRFEGIDADGPVITKLEH